ncbi:MAG: ComF family protein [Prevotella sp.]|nr:ComF family protein [Prevotella sp.]
MKTSFWTRIFDLVAPRACAVCGCRLSPNESVLCARCHLHLPLTGFEKHPDDNEMAQRFWVQIPIERAAALFFYEAQSELARMIYDMKYHHRPDIGESLGRITARLFVAQDFFRDIDAIIPVPLSRWRYWQRGYNQSEEIARGVADVTGLPIYNKVVRRTRFDQSQTRLSPYERRTNTAEAFQLVDGDKIRGLHLLIVDDIVTTGATILALASELQRAGDMRFSVLSLGYSKS